MLLVKMMLLGFKQKIKLNHTIVIVMTILMETLSKIIFNFALKKQLNTAHLMREIYYFK